MVPVLRRALMFGGIMVLLLIMCIVRQRTEYAPLIERQAGSSRHHTRSLLGHSDSRDDSQPQNNSLVLKECYENKRGFAVSLQYPGQQGAGIRALASFQCFLGSLTSQLAIVEPYFEGTKLRGLSTSNDKINLGSMFDFDNFNAASKKIGYPELFSLNEFIAVKPKPMIIVRTVNKLGNRVVWSQPAVTSHSVETESHCLRSTDMMQLSAEEIKMADYVMATMKQLQSNKTCIVRVVNLDVATTSFTRQEIQNLIYGNWKPEEVTLCFSYWSGPFSIPLPDPAHGQNCRQNFVTVGTEPQFKPSRRLIEDAQTYRTANLNGDKSMAIMFRLEKIIDDVKAKTTAANTAKKVRLKYSMKKIRKCIGKVKDLVDELSANRNSIPVVTMDVGNLGSTSLKGDTSKLLRMANYTLSTLTHSKWSMSKWEESYANLSKGEIRSKSYAAALQRTLASQSECLILVGGGNFQALALQDYMRRRQLVEDVAFASGKGGVSRSLKKPCVHVLCASRKNEALIKRILQRYHSHS